MNLRLKKVFASLIGILLFGISVGLLKFAAFGVDPFQTMMSGLEATFSVSYSTLYIIVNVIMILTVFLIDKSKIGLATVLNLLFMGYIIEEALNFLLRLIPTAGLVVRLIALILGLFLTCFAAATYYTADLGVSPYDAIAIILANKQDKIPFKYCRVGTDIICVVIGVVLYLVSGKSFSECFAIAGIGTVISAFFTGPLIDFFKRKVLTPILYGKGEH